MSESTKIEWTDSTFNPWVGCTKITPACDHCYAESWALRSGMVKWGGDRRRTSATLWKQPLKWQRDARTFLAQNGRRHRVFCASLSDVFDNQADPTWRRDLCNLIENCPDLDWLLLTKRPQNITKLLPEHWLASNSHVWLGATCEDQKRYDQNWSALAKATDGLPNVTFISYEPALEPLRLEAAYGRYPSWLICGGESGHHARAMDLRWARNVRDQCLASGTAFFMKQLGSATGYNLHDKKGGDWAEWPADLRVRQWPDSLKRLAA